MKLLGAILYDPSGSVSKATTAALAMTAFDTTNLRLTVTVPSHGYIRVRIRCVIHGATTAPAILLGVKDGSTVRGRVAPKLNAANMAATTLVVAVADFIINGLTPGSMTLDAAYGVETLVASTGIKYGGANDTTANNAFGGLTYEIYDPLPQPTNFALLSIDASGRVDVSKVAGTTQTAGDLAAMVSAVDDYIDTEVAAIKAKTDLLAFGDGANLDVNVKKINSTTVTGTGAVGDEWGP